MAEFSTLNVTAGNGSGTALLLPSSPTHTFIVAGAFLGLVTIEGSSDGLAGWVPVATFQVTDFVEIPFPWLYARVTRVGVPATGAPGLPSVSVGACPAAVASIELTPPVTLNGAGVGVDVSTIQIAGVVMLGAFPTGAVISVEISEDNVNWAALPGNNTRPGMRQIVACALWARMVVSGRTSAAALPQVTVAGLVETVVAVELTPPVLNGAGATIDTSLLGAAKTIIFASPTGDIPGQVSIEASNDAGASWCDVLMMNAVGLRFITGMFQSMRMVVRNLSTPLALSIGVGALDCACPTPVIGANFTDVSLGGV